MSGTPVQQKSTAGLMLSAIGVVYGDIGTSPLYAIKECFTGAHQLTIDPPHILGVLSLVFWSVMIVVSFKYVSLMIRADNRGEGGSLALLTLVAKLTKGTNKGALVVALGIFAAALFYGDSMITPAISVLSAVEGLQVTMPALDVFIIPLTLLILTALFFIQRKGSGSVGGLFGPVMCIWFAILGLLGIASILREPAVLAALNPLHAARFFFIDPWLAFLALGSVVLALTGAEALYTDIGHFGKRPIRITWFVLVLPALLLNYFGQGALLLREPAAIENPFYYLAPPWAQLPLVILATMATVIASQAVISGAFSVSQQAVQLGYLPRMSVVHTSTQHAGQIYVPFINWTLLVFVLALVLGFQSSTHLAAAYGIAVTGTMLIDTLLISAVIFLMWRWNRWIAVPVVALLLTVDLAFFLANTTKLAHGGWFPLLIGLIVFTLLTTWKRGRELLATRLRTGAMPLDILVNSIGASVTRVPGTAVFMTNASGKTPQSLLHNLKHNKVLHERVVMLYVVTEEVPHVAEEQRIESKDLGGQFYWITLHYGFMEIPDIPAALERCAAYGLPFDLMDTSFFLNRETLIPSVIPGMALWRERLFAWMSRNATGAMVFFKIPANRVVELGCQVEI